MRGGVLGFQTILPLSRCNSNNNISRNSKSEVCRCLSSRVLAGTSTHVDLKHIEFTVDDVDGMVHDPVILLHGLLGQKRNFSSMGNSLASQLKNKRRIFALDLRNHGDNTHDWRNEMSYSHMAQDVIGFMDKMGLARAVLVGHSMGGKVAKSLALASPDRVAGLVVMDIAPVKYTDTDASWSAVQSIIETLKQVQLSPGKTKRDVDVELRTRVEDPALRAFVLTNLDVTSSGEEGPTLRWKINIHAVADQLHRIASFDVNSLDLGDPDGHGFNLQYQGDTFLIKGGASSFVKGSHMDVISKHFPNYMVTTIKGCGHWVHAESPEATLALLKKYLDR
jgi:Predicted hydrolases or acyltransferases (alpha/beta hydrolase superfamily)